MLHTEEEEKKQLYYTAEDEIISVAYVERINEIG